MSHSSEKRWHDASSEASQVANDIVTTLNSGEEKYLQLLEVFTFAGATDAGLAALLFKEHISARADTGPTADEIVMATDLKNAMIAVHELWQAANNVAVAAAQRAQTLRRMI